MTEDLSQYQLPLLPVPDAVQEAIVRGVVSGDVPAPGDAATFLRSRGELPHAVTRAADGRLLVTPSVSRCCGTAARR